MLNPDVVARLRAAIRAGDSVDRFDGYPVRRSPVIAADANAEVLGREDLWAAEMTAPSAIFGEPVDAKCLTGVGAAVQQVPQKLLLKAQNASIIGNNVVLTEEGRIYAPSPVSTPACLQRLVVQNSKNYQGFVVECTAEQTTAYYVSREAPLRLRQTALFLHNLEAGNYGSFIFRQLPQMLFTKHFGLDFDVYVVPSRTSWLPEALELAGMPRKPIYTVREVSGDSFASVIFCNEFDGEGFLSPTTVAGMRELAREAVAAAGRTITSSNLRSDKLFISRALCTISKPKYRPLKNELDIEKMFSELGFAVWHPETLTFVDQVCLFSNAKCIVGPSGSGMLNAVFAPPQSRVLDMESFHSTVRQHAKIYASTGKTYAFMFGCVDDVDGQPFHLRPWTVPPTLWNEARDWLLSTEH